MVTMQQAYETAKEHWPEIDYCTEYENVFVFIKKGHIAFRGPNPVAIMKDTGKVVGILHFINEVDRGLFLREGYVSEN